MDNAFVAIVPTRPGPLFGRPVHRRGSPHRFRPGASPQALQIPPRGGHPALPGLCGQGQRGITPAFGYSALHPSARRTLTSLSTPLPGAHYGPADSRPRPPDGLWIPRQRFPVGQLLLPRWPRRASQVPRPISRRARSPTTPSSPVGASARFFPTGGRLQHLWGTGHCHKRNEAESGSLTRARVFAVRGVLPLRLRPACARDRLCFPLTVTLHGESRLHAERAIRMADTFQSARLTRLGLAHQRPQRKPGSADLVSDRGWKPPGRLRWGDSGIHQILRSARDG